MTDKHRTVSTPEMTSQSDFELPNVTTRSKRLRPDFSPETEWTTAFEKRIMNLLTSWKEDQNLVLKKITSDIAEVKQQNIMISSTNNEIEKSLEFINNGYESLRQLVEKLEKERIEQRDYIWQLEKKIADLQQSTRPSTVEIRNVPLQENETTKDLTATVLQTSKAIQATVTEFQLRDVYRLPGKKGSIRPIICDFSSVAVKHQFLNASRAFNKDRPINDKLNTTHIGLNGPPCPVFIAEHLPNSMRQLFYETRNFARSNNFKFCWTQNGKLFLREREGAEAIIIKTTSCLGKLIKSLRS